MSVLVAGGAGYIGSTICSALQDNGVTPVILDALITGSPEYTKGKIFYQGDVGDKLLLEELCAQNPDIAGIIYCAELPASPVSVREPYAYYLANVVKSMEFFKNAIDLGYKRFVYSSSASIYDHVAGYMVAENSPINPSSPFARAKYMTELMLKDFCMAYDTQAIALRCFNPVGADPQLRSGSLTKSYSIIDRLIRSLSEESKVFKIAGSDWNTRDGTGIRDYIHVWDLAMAHVCAFKYFDAAIQSSGERYLPINVGSGQGVTVDEFIYAFQNVCGEQIQTIESQRRPGDFPGAYASIKRAKELIHWEPVKPVEEAILDAIRWYEKSQ